MRPIVWYWAMLIVVGVFAPGEAYAKFNKNKSVVYIVCTFPNGSSSQGSGVIVSEAGVVLTARHLIPDEHLKDNRVTCKAEIGTGARTPSRNMTRGPWHTYYDAMILTIVPAPVGEKFEAVRYVRLTEDMEDPPAPITAYGFPDQRVLEGQATPTGQVEGRAGTIAGIVPRDNGSIPTVSLTPRGMSGGPVILDRTGALVGIVNGTSFDPQNGSPTDFGVLAAQVVNDHFVKLDDVSPGAAGSVATNSPAPGPIAPCEGRLPRKELAYGRRDHDIGPVWCRIAPGQKFRVFVQLERICLTDPTYRPVAALQVRTNQPPSIKKPIPATAASDGCNSEEVEIEAFGTSGSDGVAVADIRIINCLATPEPAAATDLKCIVDRGFWWMSAVQ